MFWLHEGEERLQLLEEESCFEDDAGVVGS